MDVTMLSVTDAVRNFSDIINRVSYAREVFILKRGRQKLAELRPVSPGRTLRSLPGILTSLPKLSATESKSFEKDMVALRKGIRREEVRDPWES